MHKLAGADATRALDLLNGETNKIVCTQLLMFQNIRTVSKIIAEIVNGLGHVNTELRMSGTENC